MRDEHTPQVRAVLSWVMREQRYLGEAQSRWGHYLDEAIELGVVTVGLPEAYLRGRVRDIRTPIYPHPHA